jgi:dephospho-CoA kinase
MLLAQNTSYQTQSTLEKVERMATEKLVLGLTGMPGSGKSVVVKVAKTLGYECVAMGDVVREEAKTRGLEPTPENIGHVMLQLRHMEGTGAIAARSIPRIEKAKNQKIIVDGIRSLPEVEEFRKHFKKFKLMAIHTSPETRFKRLYNRRRSDDAPDWDVFYERDMRELSVGLGGAIAMAEYVIVNEGPVGAVKATVKTVLRKVEQKWTK